MPTGYLDGDDRWSALSATFWNRRHLRPAICCRSCAADVLVRTNSCRSQPLGQRDYQCEPCDQTAVVFNSCGERHCCRCSGFFRLRWLYKTQALLVPGTSYLQIVLTVPDTIGELFQYAPAAAYAMLMRTAAREVMRLQKRLGITPGAIVVLHTWNQLMMIHVHVHVLIPVAGIGIECSTEGDDDQWVSVADRPELAQGDQFELGRAFRTSIIRRIKRLQKHGKLIFSGKHEHLNEPAALTKHLASIAPRATACSCNIRPRAVMIQRRWSNIWRGMSVVVRSPTGESSQLKTARSSFWFATINRPPRANEKRKSKSRFLRRSSCVAGRSIFYRKGLCGFATMVTPAPANGKRTWRGAESCRALMNRIPTRRFPRPFRTKTDLRSTSLAGFRSAVPSVVSRCSACRFRFVAVGVRSWLAPIDRSGMSS